MDARYERRRSRDQCVSCGAPAVGGVRCRPHRLEALWAAIRSRAAASGHAPLAAAAGEFAAWYEAASEGGACPWCGGARGEGVVDYDRGTGRLRALVCRDCAAASRLGERRLELVLAAVRGQPPPAAVATAADALRPHFERWAQLVERRPRRREERMREVVRELRRRLPTDDEVTRAYERFRAFLDAR